MPLKLVGYNRERGRKLVPQHLQSANLRPGLSSVWQSPPPSLLLSGIFLPLPRPSSTPPHHIPATPPAHTPFPLPTSPQGLRRKLFFYNLLVPGNRLPRGGASFEFLRPRPLPPPTHSDWRVYGGGAEAGAVGTSVGEICPLDRSALPKKDSWGRWGGTVGVAGGAASARWRVRERLLLAASRTRRELPNQHGLGAPPLLPPHLLDSRLRVWGSLLGFWLTCRGHQIDHFSST